MRDTSPVEYFGFVCSNVSASTYRISRALFFLLSPRTFIWLPCGTQVQLNNLYCGVWDQLSRFCRCSVFFLTAVSRTIPGTKLNLLSPCPAEKRLPFARNYRLRVDLFCSWVKGDSEDGATPCFKFHRGRLKCKIWTKVTNDNKVRLITCCKTGMLNVARTIKKSTLIIISLLGFPIFSSGAERAVIR